MTSERVSLWHPGTSPPQAVRDVLIQHFGRVSGRVVFATELQTKHGEQGVLCIAIGPSTEPADLASNDPKAA